MTVSKHEDWIDAAREKAQARMTAAQQSFGLGSHARYAMDLSDATITFHDEADVPVVVASIQVAGSWAAASRTWLWGWAHDGVPVASSSRLDALRRRGKADGIEALQASLVECDEGDAWTLASLAADVLEAECVYRAGGERNDIFLLLFDIRRLH